MSEKPLHVRVAEALGCKPAYLNGAYFAKYGIDAPETWYCRCCPQDHGWRPQQHGPIVITAYGGMLAHYDTDWSATGPLIERLWLVISPCVGKGWSALAFHEAIGLEQEGATPLIAVCNLILALHEAGKLQGQG